MKNKNCIPVFITSLLLLFAGVGVAIGQTACQANFSASQTAPNVVSFTSTSTAISSSTIYHWSFGDGYIGSGSPVSHTYYNPGLYVVCLKIFDSISPSACFGIYCDTVRVTGTPVCHLTVQTYSHPASCNTCHNGLAEVIGIEHGKPPYTYSWSNGSTSRVDTGLAAGNYVVCVTDGNHCTTCDTVKVRYLVPHCHASFYLQRDTAVPGSYYAVSTSLGVRPFHYLWTWGDGSASDTAAHPIHTYANPGVYRICLTLTDAVGCSSTWCSGLFARSESTNPFGPATVSVIDDPNAPSYTQEQSASFIWSLYPNPSEDNTTLSYTHANTTAVTIHIFDVNGRLVQNLKSVSNEQAGAYLMNVNTSALKPGIYLIQIQTNNQVDTKRLNVIH